KQRTEHDRQIPSSTGHNGAVSRPPLKKSDGDLQTALACGATVEHAARKCGVSTRTVYRRLKDATFIRQIQATRDELDRRRTDNLTAVGLEAVAALRQLLQPTVAAPTRLGAARVALELGARYREPTNFAERLAAVEERLAAGALSPEVELPDE